MTLSHVLLPRIRHLVCLIISWYGMATLRAVSPGAYIYLERLGTSKPRESRSVTAFISEAVDDTHVLPIFIILIIRLGRRSSRYEQRLAIISSFLAVFIHDAAHHHLLEQ